MDMPDSIPDFDEVDQKRRADELAVSLNAHVLHRQKLTNALEQEFGQTSGWGTDESPEDAAVRLLRYQAVTLAQQSESIKQLERLQSARLTNNAVLTSALLAIKPDMASELTDNLYTFASKVLTTQAATITDQAEALKRANETAGALQAAQIGYNEEVAVLVKALEELDPSMGLKAISNVVVYAAGQLRAQAKFMADVQESLKQEVGKIVAILEEIDPSLERWQLIKTVSNAVVCAVEKLRAQAKDITELREDLAEAEAEAARFSKQNRQMSARSAELIAEVKTLRTELYGKDTKPASPLDRIPSDPPLDLKSALDRANAATADSGFPGDLVDLSSITKAELTGESFETFANFFIIEAVVGLDRLAGVSGDAVRRIFGERERIRNAKILLTINGVRVPFLDVLRRFHADWHRLVRASAVKLVEEHFSERTSEIYTLLDDLKERLEVVLADPKKTEDKPWNGLD